MYTTERLSKEITVKQYIEEYVNIEEFLECCKECSNYGMKWSCPPSEFDVLEYWKQFDNIFLLGNKITFDEKSRQRVYEKDELRKIMNDVLSKEKQKLTQELFEMEKLYEGSVSLSAGSCDLCGSVMMESDKCSRSSCKNGNARENCRHFDKMRYSIESLGGNVGKTCSKLLGIDLEWVEENKLPSYFVLVCGLLKE